MPDLIEKSKPGKFKLQELNAWFLESKSHNKPLFAEQRSNHQLHAGDHYARKLSDSMDRFRGSFKKENTKFDRVRLTKNHIQRICKRYINNLLGQSPSVGVEPKNKDEIADRKSAELHGAIWEDFKKAHKFHKLTRELAYDYVVGGEAWLKITWDDGLGFKGFEKVIDEETQLPTGEETPVYDGDFSLERLQSTDVMTDANADSFEKSLRNGIEKMVPTRRLKKLFPKLKEKIAETPSGTFKIWNSVNNEISRNPKGMTLVRELYERPSPKFPEGYFVISTEDVILAEGELPKADGKTMYPLIMVGWDEITKSARARSIIKHLRPYQAEINRAGSKIAEHHITVGDDKIIVQDGTRVTEGSLMPGIRIVEVSGPEPKIVEGRTGQQFVEYVGQQIAEMYEVAMLQEDELGKDTAAQDPYAFLYRSMKQKKAFSLYADKFVDFLTEICEFVLLTAKEEYSEKRFVRAAGRNEQINIDEFKSSNFLDSKVTVSEKNGDLDTQFGKQMAIQHMLQFVGQQLDPEDIGRLAKAMPFLNDEQLFSGLTINEDNAENLILWLDKGKPVRDLRFAEQNPQFMIKRLNHRMNQPDYEFMPQEVQKNYETQIGMYEELELQRTQQLQAAQAGFIPMGGGLVTINMNAPNPETGSNKRISLPSGALEWLIQKLQDQGLGQEEFFGLPDASKDRISKTLAEGQGKEQNKQAAAVANMDLDPQSKHLKPGEPVPQIPDIPG